MKLLKIILIILPFISGANFIQCMHQAIAPYHKQPQITLHLLDGDFVINERKIFESIPLHHDYLRRQQSCNSVTKIFPLYCDVTVKEMKLVSDALNKEPGKPLLDYYNSLSKEDRNTLIIATGQYNEQFSEDGKKFLQKKLHVPSLIAQLIEIYCPKEIDLNIKKYLEREDWQNYITRMLSTHSIISSSYIQPLENENFVHIYNQDGSFYVGPKCLTKESNSPFYNNIACVAEKKSELYDIKNYGSFMLFYHKHANNHSYLITGCERDNQSEIDNECLLWVIDDSGKNDPVATHIKHPEKIIDYKFSNSGEYLLTTSGDQIILSQITIDAQQHSSVKNNILIDQCFPTACCHNNQSTTIATGLYDRITEEPTLKIWDVSGNLIKIHPLKNKREMICDILFSHDDSRLLTISRNTETSSIILWDISDLQNIHPLKTFIRNTSDYYLDILCGADRDNWALITKKGNICIIHHDSDDYKIVNNGNVEAPVMQTKAVYSPSRRFLATIELGTGYLRWCSLWDMVSHEHLASFMTPANNIDGIGFTPDESAFILIKSITEKSYKKTILHTSDQENLSYLMDNTSLFQLYLLRRLYRAYKNETNVTLYEEEPAYKALNLLEQKPRNIIAKYFRIN